MWHFEVVNLYIQISIPMLHLLETPLFCSQREVPSILAMIAKVLHGDEKIEVIAGKKDYDLYDVWINDVPWDFEIQEEKGIAILSIYGSIYKYFYYYGMDVYSAVLKKLYQDTSIKGIILRIESGGGEWGGLQMMAETLKLKNKPVIAYVEDYAFSAAYGITACCDLIFANTPMCEVGSVGTYIRLLDYEKYYTSVGIDIHTIYATKSTDKNLSYREALEGKYEKMVENIDVYNEYFINLIQQNRGQKLKSDQSEWGTGKTYFAPTALELGLIDGIYSLDQTIEGLIL